jgi:putative SOS response-associated peptidase YedK
LLVATFSEHNAAAWHRNKSSPH